MISLASPRQSDLSPNTDCYSVLAYRMMLRSDSQEVRALFHRAFGEFRDSELASGDDHMYSVSTVAAGFHLAYAELGELTVPTWQEAYGLLEWAVTQAVLRRIDHGVALHAAALEWRGAALLLVGTSGAGKSTLALDLLRLGCGYMSDEAALLTSGHADVAAFPRALVIKGAPDDHGPAIAGRTYLSPSALGCRVMRGAIPPGAVILLAPIPGAAMTLRPTTCQKALPQLLRQVFAPGPAEIILATLVALVRRAPLFELTFCDSARAADAMIALCDRLAAR